MHWKVYLVRCADNTLYCGITNDITNRIEKHNAGKNLAPMVRDKSGQVGREPSDTIAEGSHAK